MDLPSREAQSCKVICRSYRWNYLLVPALSRYYDLLITDMALERSSVNVHNESEPVLLQTVLLNDSLTCSLLSRAMIAEQGTAYM